MIDSLPRRSKACQPCRAKRRRCDFKKPQCTQCLRAKVLCSGYRDAETLIFRDETESVSQKAEIIYAEKMAAKLRLEALANHKHHRRVSRKGSIESDEEPDHEDLAWLSSIPSADQETNAIGYFFNVYVSDTPFNYLPGLWPSLAANEMVQYATLASSYAALHRSVGCPKLMLLARSNYANALTAINRALQLPELATHNATLLSVLLLSIFEALTFRGRKLPKSWTAHINGLLALLDSRGEQQFYEPFGSRLFNTATLLILAHCGQSETSVPQRLNHLQSLGCQILGPTNYGLKIGRVLIDMSTLRVSMNGALATEVVEEALRLDSNLLSVLNHMSLRSVMAQNMGNSPPQDTKSSYVSLNDWRQWNTLRMLRMSLQEWIYSAFQPELSGVIANEPSPLDPLYPDWHELPGRALLEFEMLADDVLGSVDYVMTERSKPAHEGVRFLVWPLATAAASELCSVTTREAILDTLRLVNKNFGMSQTQEALDILESGAKMKGWLHLLHFS